MCCVPGCDVAHVGELDVELYGDIR
jgi:hypothetical protein